MVPSDIQFHSCGSVRHTVSLMWCTSHWITLNRDMTKSSLAHTSPPLVYCVVTLVLRHRHHIILFFWQSPCMPELSAYDLSAYELSAHECQLIYYTTTHCVLLPLSTSYVYVFIHVYVYVYICVVLMSLYTDCRGRAPGMRCTALEWSVLHWNEGHWCTNVL